ncbi:MAG: DUF4037 domain-containing protein [Lachnospiraceae bacterium]|nr:DUF4037 domain-containing protein [Lachnospiraceae bacterium]
MVQDIFNEFAKFSQVRAMAVGGSRAVKRNDEFSDYDVYVYLTETIPSRERLNVLEPYCNSIVLDNHYREHEDVCIMEDRTELNIVYRELDTFLEGIARVAEQHEPLDGCTTGMWNSLLTGRIAYDKGGYLAAAKEKYSMPYPKQLKDNIISHHMNLIKYGIPSFMAQMEKAMKRKDMININQCAQRFLDSYFDIIFALNEKMHPGEKRLIQVCLEECKILPANFEINIRLLLNSMFKDPAASAVMDLMVTELEKVVGQSLA